MKKIFFIIALTIFISPTESLAKKDERQKLDPLSPEKIERILDSAANEIENENHVDEIKKYYDGYMKSLKKFNDRMIEAFKDFF